MADYAQSLNKDTINNALTSARHDGTQWVTDVVVKGSSLTYANRLPAYLVNSSGTEPVISAFGDSSGAATALIATQAVQYGFNGASRDQIRVANVFKYVGSSGVTNGATFTVWAPPATKKFRLMGCVVRMSTPGYCAFRDGLAGSGSTIIPLPATSAGVILNLGQGKVSSAANNVLEIVNASGGTSDFQVAVWGTEE